MAPAELADRLRAGERGAVSQALNLVEDQRPAERHAAAQLLDQLEGTSDAALRVGVTGAPGSGKSTLIDALIRELRRRERTVGVIAVDPSSRQSGGALLGDRLRVRSGSGDEGVFLRSMAARDRLGGLADATRDAVQILAAAFDVVFVETVGVGQSESEVANLVHSLIFVAQPGAGDSIQFMKAGILEMPDIFVVNKADLGAPAERTRNELLGGLGLGEARGDGWQPPAILTSARDNRGIDEVVDALFAHRAHLEQEAGLEARLRRGRCESALLALAQRYGSHGLEAVGGRDALLRQIEAAPGLSIGSLVRDLGEKIEKQLQSPG